MLSILLATPPLTTPGNPYPATAYLTGFLRSRGIAAHQADLSIMLTTRLLSRAWLPLLRQAAERYVATRENPQTVDRTVAFFLTAYDDYYRAIDPVMAFLQGQDPTLAHRIASRSFCPAAPDFTALEVETALLERALGKLALQERARYLAAHFIHEVLRVITVAVDQDFTPWEYAGQLVGPDFRPLAAKLDREPSLIDRELLGLWLPLLEAQRPDLVCLTVPFRANLYGALRLGKAVRERLPAARIALGGGFIGNYLRNPDEPALFELVDYIVLDAGERPLERLIAHLEGRLPLAGLHRTWVREKGRIGYQVQQDLADVPQEQLGTPSYAALPLATYFAVTPYPNPGAQLLTGLRWNQLTLAYGCYWKRCAFCDTHLDYVRRYDPTPVERVVERMERLAAETGYTGFHFVDEAAPPKLLKALSQALIERGLGFSWYTNIRFERAFADPALTDLMARAGCIAVSGGIETTSDRLLALVDKGTTIEQTARACRALSRSGILVHAYLIYGLPTETEQETIENLERIRQLFALGYIRSAFWQRFTLTLHSPMGQDPERYGIRPCIPPGEGIAQAPLSPESVAKGHDLHLAIPAPPLAPLLPNPARGEEPCSAGISPAPAGETPAFRQAGTPALPGEGLPRARREGSGNGEKENAEGGKAGSGAFTRYAMPYQDPTPYDHELLGAGLERANHYFMLGFGLDQDIRTWFAKPFAPPRVPPDFIRSLAPPEEGTGARHRPSWYPAGTDWTDRPRHGFRVPELVMIHADGEDLTLLDLRNRDSYRLEDIGAECWRLLAAGLSLPEIAENLAQTYRAPRERVLADISALIDELCENGLLRPNSTVG